jgi:hypothetical protein
MRECVIRIKRPGRRPIRTTPWVAGLIFIKIDGVLIPVRGHIRKTRRGFIEIRDPFTG